MRAFGALDAKLLVVGLAPGLRGANATGRPFTGDYAGIILYGALKKAGLAKGEYKADPNDGFTLVNTRVTNGVRCVPPQNKPTPEEIRTCNRFLQSEIASMPSLRVILSLGAISHQAVLRALGRKQSSAKFKHAAEHDMGDGLTLLDSYHTSRYNINTGVLTDKMFEHIVLQAKKLVSKTN